mmetsp:Transcript_343/g.936  ORF Transcript_343/g.936 Transcript_343/m.936 type:complete len:234 (+) Transcript_343:414-1115(+)
MPQGRIATEGVQPVTGCEGGSLLQDEGRDHIEQRLAVYLHRRKGVEQHRHIARSEGEDGAWQLGHGPGEERAVPHAEEGHGAQHQGQGLRVELSDATLRLDGDGLEQLGLEVLRAYKGHGEHLQVPGGEIPDHGQGALSQGLEDLGGMKAQLRKGVGSEGEVPGRELPPHLPSEAVRFLRRCLWRSTKAQRRRHNRLRQALSNGIEEAGVADVEPCEGGCVEAELRDSEAIHP